MQVVCACGYVLRVSATRASTNTWVWVYQPTSQARVAFPTVSPCMQRVSHCEIKSTIPQASYNLFGECRFSHSISHRFKAGHVLPHDSRSTPRQKATCLVHFMLPSLWLRFDFMPHPELNVKSKPFWTRDCKPGVCVCLISGCDVTRLSALDQFDPKDMVSTSLDGTSLAQNTPRFRPTAKPT